MAYVDPGGASLKTENQKYFSKTPSSLKMWKMAKALTPFGVHSNYRFTRPYPVYFRRGIGGKIVDIDRNEYIDFNMGFGALVSGHANPKLVHVLKERLENSSVLGFEDENSYTAAELINKRYGTEMVRFSTTGTEATMHAVRIARAFTGRQKILKFEGCYHGSNQDLLFSVKPNLDDAGLPARPSAVAAGPGIPEFMKKGIAISQFNDLDATTEIVEANQNDLAAVILEPYPMNMGVIVPRRDFISGLRDLCDEYGIALIFDEVKTCGKFYGGAEEVLGIRPDLKVLGKAIGGGIAVSAIAGKKEIMENVGPGAISHAGTFNSNPLSMSAVVTSLRDVLTKQAVEKAQRLSETMAEGYSDLLQLYEIPSTIPLAGLSGAISFNMSQPQNWREFLRGDIGRWNYYYLSMMNRGVIPAGPGADEQWTVSVMHTEEDIEKTIEVFKEVVPRISLRYPLLGVEESV